MRIENWKEIFTEGVECLSVFEDGKGVECVLPKEGGGLDVTQYIKSKERYLSFYLENLEEHSLSMNLLVYRDKDPGDGKDEAYFDIRFGVLPRIRTFICLDLNWLDGHILFPEAEVGELKVVCHGGRVEKGEIRRAVLENFPTYHPVRVKISRMELTDERPQRDPLQKDLLVDSMGQTVKKEWPGKLHSPAELSDVLNGVLASLTGEYPFPEWDAYGGDSTRKLTEGTGFFSKIKKDGRWYLTDPLGNAFFSMGPDGVVARADCRVDGMEQYLEWLPAEDDPVFGKMFAPSRGGREERRRTCKLFSYEMANLYKAFGEDWYEKWKKLIVGQLRQYGMNTLGNWSDSRLYGAEKHPYVTMLPRFPSTQKKIFRDFPDVLSEEYTEDAQACAQWLTERKDDPYQIGYFLRNEPSWAFVDNLILAEEVLYNPERTVCREKLIEALKEKYGTPEALSRAWKKPFESFDDLYAPMRKASEFSEEAKADLKAFSRILLRAYVEIPSKACRRVDPNHMILGMRWAWISDPDLVTGWENFDVFSINCYAVDPTPALDNVKNLGVDLPIMIGEFHFGALDGGPTATGLEGVATQADRGIAYRYYCQRTAAHPYGVGCHYFQCYDQFTLGRFDGENYNIGLFDICSQPYPAMLEKVRECSRDIYGVKEGSRLPSGQKPVSIPMIAY